uniref:Ymf64 n=1 Tax=Tetrahymena malaccensis TaxID=5901 RepID=Q09FB2_TETMA|nr:Ymf64 [Tetrahymena malaccensis]ABI51639.1 Ymf64 [Tetrahymena malaccensis]
MKLLILLKKINVIKKIENINSENFDNQNYRYNIQYTLQPIDFINYKHINFLLNKTNIIFLISLFNHSNINFNKLFYIFLYSLEKVDIDSLNFFKNMLFNKFYSNYNVTLFYSIATKEIKKNKEEFFKNNTNKTLLIRNTFKTTNLRLLRKISIIDLILKKYLESQLDDKISINFDKYNLKFMRKKKLYVKVLRRKLRRMRKMLRWSKISLRNFIRLTLIFLCTKDIDIFSKVLVKIMDSMHYKNHRRFLYYLKLFISKSMHYYFSVLRFEGFFFYLSGKISGGGNSKKKNYAVKCGKYSLTNKMLKLKYKKGLIHTKTGVLGYKLMISYK